MKTNVVVAGSVAVLFLVPLALLWYRGRKQGTGGRRDRMDERQHVKKNKDKIVRTTTIEKEDVRFVIGKRGCVIKDIESRCGVKISFPEDSNPGNCNPGNCNPGNTSQIVEVKGDCNDDITEAIEMVQEACQLKPKILTEDIEIRAEYCGKIIGKGGENLKDIREQSGTRILISKEPVEGNEDIRLCSIEGTKEEIEVAKQLIDGNILTEIEIRRKREHRQEVKNYLSSTVNGTSLESRDESDKSRDSQSDKSRDSQSDRSEEDDKCSHKSYPLQDSSVVAVEVAPSPEPQLISEFLEEDLTSDAVPSPEECFEEDLPTVVYLKDQRDFDPNIMLDSVCLPPLSPIQSVNEEIDSESQVTVIASSLSSNISNLATNGGSTCSSTSSLTSNLVNEQMTLNLKSMLGINKNGHGELVHDEPGTLLPDTLLDKALFECSVYSYNHGSVDMRVEWEEFEGVITCAKCCSHVWIVNRQSNCLPIINNMLSEYSQLSPLHSVKMNRLYLFMDQSTGTNCRIITLQSISKTLVECYDVDTGVVFAVPRKCLTELPEDLAGLPPAAVCVSIGASGCGNVASSELIGKVVTVTPRDMGANKEIKYPRVKIHRDQIVYNNYRPYVSSPKPTEAVSLPNGSSLVYVSAIHNAGHFYVQACGKNISELDRLESAMAQHYGSVETLPQYSWDPVPGQMCGVWHTSEQIWLRGQIKELDNSDMLYIKYMDYGDTVHLPHSHTRKLRAEFMELPYQAIECFLANTIPITTRQWTPDATAKFDALTQCGQWYPLRCVVVGERHGKPCVELYDQPYSDKEYSVGECLCTMDYARSSKMEIPAVQTLSTPIPSFASGAAYLVSPDFDDVDDELEELFACDDDSDSADSDDFPVSRENVSNLLLSLGNQITPQSTQCKKNNPKYRPQTCGQAKNNAFMERRESTDSNNNPSEQTTPQPQRKNRFSTQESSSTSDSDNISESDQSNFYETPRGSSPKSTTSSYASAAEFNNTFVAPLDTPYQNSVTPLHLSSAEDTDCG
ncbi:uncharacterized protein LOC134811671 isoform X2 [Bolinopsis microptera]|uniref:uncharacterized protein LOC134811671 isoform X2 n=1 Tax=Bolinopsis microptera TaxID=2820187 RepID=UPI00307A4506